MSIVTTLISSENQNLIYYIMLFVPISVQMMNGWKFDANGRNTAVNGMNLGISVFGKTKEPCYARPIFLYKLFKISKSFPLPHIICCTYVEW